MQAPRPRPPEPFLHAAEHQNEPFLHAAGSIRTSLARALAARGPTPEQGRPPRPSMPLARTGTASGGGGAGAPPGPAGPATTTGLPGRPVGASPQASRTGSRTNTGISRSVFLW